jgi:hypothetical protein
MSLRWTNLTSRLRQAASILVAGAVLTSCEHQTDPGVPALTLNLDVSDSVRFGDSVHARWTVSNAGTAPATIRNFMMRLEPDPGSQLQGDIVFCGIGWCSDIVPPRSTFVDEFAYPLTRGEVTDVEPLVVTVSYRAPNGDLRAVDTAWVHP